MSPRETELLQDTLLSSRCEVQELKGKLESLQGQLNAMSSAVNEANRGFEAAELAAEQARDALIASEHSQAESQRALRDMAAEADRWRERSEALAEKHERLNRVMQVGLTPCGAESLKVRQLGVSNALQWMQS